MESAQCGAAPWCSPRRTVRYERRADILQGFLHLVCALTCTKKLQPP
jgi:hypothetical protein